MVTVFSAIVSRRDSRGECQEGEIVAVLTEYLAEYLSSRPCRTVIGYMGHECYLA